MIEWHNPDTAIVRGLVGPASRLHNIAQPLPVPSLTAATKLTVAFAVLCAGLLAAITLLGAFAS